MNDMPEEFRPQPLDDSGQMTQRVQHQQVSARVPESVARGTFASGALVINGQHEFVIDFLQSVTRPQQIAVRVVLPLSIFSGLIGALKQNIGIYTRRYGPPPALPKPAPGTPVPSVEEIYGQLKLVDEVAVGHYANTVLITHSASEFCFDFIANFYPRSTVAARVFMSVPQLPRLLETLTRSHEQYLRKLAEVQQHRPAAPPASQEAPPDAPPEAPPAAPDADDPSDEDRGDDPQ
ncbi:MAG: DUF3467 domain-containing protein [Planctomycetes bacterium]|nr:DUF3467 domain-containing protein [Planctomycetota bacterium]